MKGCRHIAWLTQRASLNSSSTSLSTSVSTSLSDGDGDVELELEQEDAKARTAFRLLSTGHRCRVEPLILLVSLCCKSLSPRPSGEGCQRPHFWPAHKLLLAALRQADPRVCGLPGRNAPARTYQRTVTWPRSVDFVRATEYATNHTCLDRCLTFICD